MRSIALLAALALLGAGCVGGGDGDAEPAPMGTAPTATAPARTPVARDAVLPSAAEQAWVEGLTGWMLAVQNAALQRNTAYLVDCASSLRATVPQPPSTRLRPLRAAAGRACRDVERALAIGPDDAAAGDRLYARAQRTFDRIVERILVASQLTLERELPVRGGAEQRASRVEPRVGSLATRLAGRRVEAHCWSGADWRRINRELSLYMGLNREIAGYASVGGDEVELAPDGCAPLVRVLYGGSWPEDGGGRIELAAAVSLLAHEVAHALGTSDEARAECWALQHVRRVAELLGAPAESARELAETQWQDVYLVAVRDDPIYGSPECRDGGKLDLDPTSSNWP